MRLTGAAGAAMAAGHVHLRGHAVARRKFGDAIAERFHHAAEFMSDGEGGMQARGRPGIPMVDVQVRAADGSGADADENFSGVRHRDLNGFNARARLGTRLAESLHRGSRHSFSCHCPDDGC